MSENWGSIADMVSPLKSPSPFAMPKPMPSGHHRTDLASASAYLHPLRCQLSTADRLQFGHGLAQLLDHQAGKSLESPAGADNELKRNGMMGEFRQYQVADFARAHLVVDIDRVQEGDCMAVARDLFQEFDRVGFDCRIKRK